MGDVLIKARTRNDGKIVYEYRFEIASVEGKRKWKSKSGFATKREAKEAGKVAQLMKNKYFWLCIQKENSLFVYGIID